MATPDEIAVWEQSVGRPLTPQEVAQLDGSLGTQGTVFDPSTPVDQVQPPMQSMAPAEPMMSTPAGAPTGMQLPGLGDVYAPQGMEEATGPMRSVTPPDMPMEPDPMAEGPADLMDAGPGANVESPFPRIDLSAIQGRQRPGGGGGGGRYRRQAQEAREDVEASRDARADSLRSVQDTIGETRDRMVGISVDQELAEQELQDQYKPKRDEAEELYQSKIRELENANRAAQDIEVKDSRTFRQRIMGAIATGIGAMAQIQAAQAGARIDNIPGRIVEQQIDRDLEEQRIELANARDTASAKRTELSAAYQNLGDIREAEAVARQALREKYAASAQQIRGELEDEQQIAEIDGLIEGMNEQSALEREALAQRRAQIAAQAAARKRQEQMRNAQRTLDALQRAESDSNLPGGLRVVDPVRFSGMTGGDDGKRAKVVSEIEESVRVGDELVSIIDELDELRSLSAAFPGTDASNRIEGLKAQLAVKASRAFELGALDQGTIDVMNDIVGDVGSVGDLLTGGAGERLDALKGSVAGSIDRRLKSSGLGFRPDSPLSSAYTGAMQSRTRPLVE